MYHCTHCHKTADANIGWYADGIGGTYCQNCIFLAIELLDQDPPNAKAPAVEMGHGETPPEGYGEFDPTTNAAQWAQYANWSTPSRWPLPGGSVNVTPRLLKCKSCGQVNSHSATCKEPW